MAYEVASMLVLSTAHITESTNSDFACMTDDIPLFFEKGEYGWFIPIVKGQAWPHTCPAELLEIRKLAEAKQCSWIMLDRDGPVVDLPTFDW
jgi:hypothetical protein